MGTIQGILVWLIFSLTFISLSVYLVVYSLRWKLEVHSDQVIIHPLFGNPFTISIGDITRIKYDTRTTAYIGDKKVFSMDNKWAIGSMVLYLRLRELGKIDGLRNKDDFIVSIPKWAAIVLTSFSLLVAGGLIAPFIINSNAVITALADDWSVMLLYIMFSLISLLLLYYAIYILRYRITVDEHVLEIRKIFSEKAYTFNDITRVDIDIHRNISIYINKKRIRRVMFINPDYPLWIMKFENEGIQISQR